MGMGARWIPVTRMGVGMGTILYPRRVWVFKWEYFDIMRVDMGKGTRWICTRCHLSAPLFFGQKKN